MPRTLKRGILGASTIILSKDIDKYAFRCGSNFYETDIRFNVLYMCHYNPLLIRNRIEKLHKMAFIIIFLFCLKKLKKLELSPQNFCYGVLHLLYSGLSHTNS